MRFLHLALFSVIIFQPNLVQAKEKLIATPINSPVKEAYVKVKLEGFAFISEAFFKPKNGASEFKGEVYKEGNHTIGKFKGSALKPGNYEYRVKVQTTSGNSSKDETALVAFITFTIDNSLEVADPGDEGKKTLAGIDSDNSGVRDDVQRWINERYPIANTPSTNKALKQSTKKMQLMILNSNNKSAAIHASDKDLEAITCLWWIKGQDSIEINKLNRAHFYNTPERIKENLKVQGHLRGTSRPTSITSIDYDDRYKLCEFPATKE